MTEVQAWLLGHLSKCANDCSELQMAAMYRARAKGVGSHKWGCFKLSLYNAGRALEKSGMVGFVAPPDQWNDHKIYLTKAGRAALTTGSAAHP